MSPEMLRCVVLVALGARLNVLKMYILSPENSCYSTCYCCSRLNPTEKFSTLGPIKREKGEVKQREIARFQVSDISLFLK